MLNYEWADKRTLAKDMLKGIKQEIKIIRDTKILLKSETEVCDIIEANIESILIYYDERTVISRQRYVTEVPNEKS